MAIELGKNKKEKNKVMKFSMLTPTFKTLGEDLVDLRRKQFAAGKVLLDKCVDWVVGWVGSEAAMAYFLPALLAW